MKNRLYMHFAMVCLTLIIFAAFSWSQDASRQASEQPQRDPFWPPGYTTNKPPPVTNIVVAPPPVEDPSTNPPPVVLEWDKAEKELRVQGVVNMRGKRTACINSEFRIVGDLVEIKLNRMVYQFKVSKIALPDQVSYEHVKYMTEEEYKALMKKDE